ncbi:Wzy polymerase domain-containing protein [Pseudomonas sp. G34]|uniref:PglL family O-oligosaccharyltransferase n=1 Tax=Pseudomonas sp. G34 TaxID=3059083 RepID=UPI00280A40D8|nr:Wzy polymerase domain-containing protein [Pseudomonas sp. G34]MDQ7983324.1 Wzy polymerase domain-containing protein [Pseudomonas sp. G34]
MSKIAFILAFLICGASFVLPVRDYPDGDFYSDATALILSLCVVVCFGRRVAVTHVVWAFSFFLLIALAVGGRGYYYQSWFLPAAAITCLFLYSSTVSAFEANFRDSFLAGCLWGVVAGGFFNVVLGYFQLFGWVDHISVLVFRGGYQVYGNFGQRNNFSTYLLVFSIALCGLIGKKNINSVLAVIILALVSLLVAYAASRMAVLAVLTLLFLALIIGRVRGWSTKESTAIYSYAFFSIFFSLCLIVLWFFDLGSSSRISAAGDASRLQEWGKAWSIFLNHPWGVGFGNYARYSFIYQLESGLPSQITWSHAHNIVFHFLVELGVWALPLLLLAIWVLKGALGSCLRNNVDGLVVAAVLLIFCVHSLLEYPLWYMNFLALFLSFLAIYMPVVKRLSGRAVRVVAACGVVLGVVVIFGYSSLAGYVYPTKDSRVNLQRMQELIEYSLNPALDWPADRVLMEYLVVEDGPEWEYKMCKAIFMVVKEPNYIYLERVALFALARQNFDFASSVLKARYVVYPNLPDGYLVESIRRIWPDREITYLQKIASERQAGFPGFKAYELTIPEYCNSYK